MLNIVKADNYYKKLKGLMGQTNINYGMYFPNVNSIHTFMMKEKIDIVGLDNKMIITEIYKKVPKNKIIFLKKSVHTLELPNNYSDKFKIGDKIDI